jgi:signal peptidase
MQHKPYSAYGVVRPDSRLIQKLKTPVRLIFLTLLAVVLGFRFYSWNAGSLSGNKMPMPFGYGLSVVLSGSMEPALQVNDLVFIHETKDIEPGDIIVYQKNNELIIHRVVFLDGDTVTTKGDANNVEDAPFDISMVKGKMVGNIPGIGFMVRAVKTPIGTIALLAAAVLLIELSYRRDKRQDDEELEAIREEINRLKRAKIDIGPDDWDDH